MDVWLASWMQKSLNRYKSKLYVQILRQGNFEAYTYTPKELRNVSIVLRCTKHGAEFYKIPYFKFKDFIQDFF